jgi:hypothetical protein
MSSDGNKSTTIAVCIKQSNEDINFNILETKENIIMKVEVKYNNKI